MIDVIVEKGAKRAFASALDWPGLARGGRDEASALDALVAAAPRYARMVAPARRGFRVPESVTELKIVQRAAGNATTDFGAPGIPAKADLRRMDDADLARTGALLKAIWRGFDATVAGAKGRTLSTGPRGGGRTLGAIAQHVRDAQLGYLSALGAPFKGGEPADAAVRAAVLAGLVSSARGEIPSKGPRGGVRWKPRFFARRLAWHAFDHALEIEDRSGASAK